MYKVLWIDDEYDKLSSFSDLAKVVFGIELIPYGVRKEGMAELERRPDDFDAVILDARIHDSTTNERPDTNALYNAIYKIKELQGKSIYFPVVIFSANRNDILDQSEFQKITADIPVFKKSIDEENLLIHLKSLIEDKPISKIKSEFQEAFELCTEDYIGKEYYDKLLKLLKVLRGIDTSSSRESLIPARKIVEGIFQKLISIGILPDEYKGKLNEPARLLRNLDKAYIVTKPTINPCIAYLVEHIVSITQDESHLKDDLKLRVDEFIQAQGTNHLLWGVTYQLIDVMVWYKKFFDEHTSLDANKKVFLKNEGIIEKDSTGRLFCKNSSGEYLLSYDTKKIKLQVGDMIHIKDWHFNKDIKTKGTYSRITKRFDPFNQ
jgi:hypothetical protein